MSKREELIEAAARAISKASGWPDDMWDNPEAYSTSSTAKEAYTAFATTALDTILAGLKADVLEYRVNGELVHELRGPPNDIWQAMLQTIEEPSHERE